MPEQRTVTVFKFDELSDEAKEKARAWYRDGGFDYDWWDSVYGDAATIADILGIDLRQRTVKLVGGGTRQEPAIYFSGFWSQGDGACFEGSYSYKKGSLEAIKQHAPQNHKLHQIARDLATIQKRWFYGLTARVKHVGRYSHEFCTEIEVFDREGNYVPKETEEAVKESLRDFMRWIYRMLEAEYDYLNSDAQVDETIRANDYEFTEDGNRYRY